MALLNITSGSSSNLAVVKVSPKVEDCFTLHEFVITVNNGDSITIELSGNHYEAKYTNTSGTTSFSDIANTNFNGYLSVTFLLLNSGQTGIYSNATITITNNTTGYYYENYSQRLNDGANCYESGLIPTKTSELLNDGHDGINPFVDSADLAGYLPLAGGTMTGSINMNWPTGTGSITNVLGINPPANNVGAVGEQGSAFGVVGSTNYIIQSTHVSDLEWKIRANIAGGDLNIEAETGIDTNLFSTVYTLNYSGTPTLPTDLTDKAYVDSVSSSDAINIAFDTYLTITSTNVQDAIQELKDEVDLLGFTTIDSTLINGSTNPVENNAIYDEFQLVPYKAASNEFTGSTNTFSNTFIIKDSANGLEIFNDGSNNRIDTNAHNLKIYGSSNPAIGWTFQTNSGLIGSSSAYIYSPYIIVDPDPYSAGWDGSNRVPTKDAIYDKIESLSLGGVAIFGTPVDNQIAVWTNSTTIEGTTGLTYNGSNLQLTGDIGSTGTRITKGWFTDLQVTNAIAGSITGNAATVTSIGNLTGDVTSINRATTISSGAVDIPMLSATGTPSASTFLRGDNTWAVPAGAGDVSKVGTPVNNQIAVWTGDGTIEGDSNFTWDGVNAKISSNNIWHEGNDGSGSGLDADTLDGNQSTAFYRSNLSNSGGTGSIQINDGYSFTVGTDSDLAIRHSGGNNLMDMSSGNLIIRDGVTTRFTFERNTGNLTATGEIQSTLLKPTQSIALSDTYQGFAVDYNSLQPFSWATIANFSDTATTSRSFQVAAEDDGSGFHIRAYTDPSWGSWNEIWTSGTDGSGSGLDADLLDGVQGSNYARTDIAETFTSTVTTQGYITIEKGSVTAGYTQLDLGKSSDTNWARLSSSSSLTQLTLYGNQDFRVYDNDSADGLTFQGGTSAGAGLAAGGKLTIDNIDTYVGGNGGYIITTDDAYDSDWNGSLRVPTQNAIYDKIQSLFTYTGGQTTRSTITSGSITAAATAYVDYKYDANSKICVYHIRLSGVSGSFASAGASGQVFTTISLPYACVSGTIATLSVYSINNAIINDLIMQANIDSNGILTFYASAVAGMPSPTNFINSSFYLSGSVITAY